MRSVIIWISITGILVVAGTGCASGQFVLDRTAAEGPSAADAGSWRQIARSGELRARGWNGPFDLGVEESAQASQETSASATYESWAPEGLLAEQVEARLRLPSGQELALSPAAVSITDGRLQIDLPAHPAHSELTIRYRLAWDGALDGLRWSFQGPRELQSSELVAFLPDQAKIRSALQRAPGSLTPDYERRQFEGPKGEPMIEHRWRLTQTAATRDGWSTAVVLWSASAIPRMPARFQLKDAPQTPDAGARHIQPVRPVDRRADPRAVQPKALKRATR